MKLLTTAAMALAISATTALAGGHLCYEGKTLTEGKLTVATGNPAYYPWVHNDAPESGEGFEAAVAYAVAEEMGLTSENVVWVRTSFDEAIQPGAKNFDVNMQQYSITEDREKVVDFSAPYYSAPMAVMVAPGVTTEATMASLKELKWGAVGTTTAVPKLMNDIQPSSDPLLYGDTADVTAAMQAGQIDAALFDLPTALFLSAVMVEGASVVGQFPADEAENPDHFGMLMEEGNALKECVDAALASLSASGALGEIEAKWLQDATGVPLIK
ncbi:MAG: ABC transporter substrate-binding protein [Marinovum sp.]|nr:ABC transporter substrate-binding protein [Marinovum sp.]